MNLTGNIVHVWSLSQLMAKALVLCHTVAILYYSMAKIEMEVFNEQQTWVQVQEVKQDPMHLYIESLYWSIATITLIGTKGYTLVETIFTMLVLLCTVGVFATILSSVGLVFDEMEQKNKQYKRSKEILNQYLNMHELTDDLQSQLHNYLKYSTQGHKEKNTNQQFEQVTESFPEHMRIQAKHEIYHEKVQTFQILIKNFSEKVGKQLINICEQEYFMPNQIIFERNIYKEPKLYVILSGEVELYQETGEIDSTMQMLKVGDTFGYQTFFTNQVPYFNARSANNSFTSVLSVSREDFLDLIQKDDYDNEKYNMIKDELQFRKFSQLIKTRCMICESQQHIESDCNLLNYQCDKTILILKYTKSASQPRENNFKRTLFRFHQWDQLDYLIDISDYILQNPNMRKYLKLIQECQTNLININKEKEQSYLEQDIQFNMQENQDIDLYQDPEYDTSDDPILDLQKVGKTIRRRSMLQNNRKQTNQFNLGLKIQQQSIQQHSFGDKINLKDIQESSDTSLNSEQSSIISGSVNFTQTPGSQKQIQNFQFKKLKSSEQIQIKRKSSHDSTNIYKKKNSPSTPVSLKRNVKKQKSKFHNLKPTIALQSPKKKYNLNNKLHNMDISDAQIQNLQNQESMVSIVLNDSLYSNPNQLKNNSNLLKISQEKSNSKRNLIANFNFDNNTSNYNNNNEKQEIYPININNINKLKNLQKIKSQAISRQNSNQSLSQISQYRKVSRISNVSNQHLLQAHHTRQNQKHHNNYNIRTLQLLSDILKEVQALKNDKKQKDSITNQPIDTQLEIDEPLFDNFNQVMVLNKNSNIKKSNTKLYDIEIDRMQHYKHYFVNNNYEVTIQDYQRYIDRIQNKHQEAKNKLTKQINKIINIGKLTSAN